MPQDLTEITKRLQADLSQEITDSQKLDAGDFVSDGDVENSLLTALKSLRANKPSERSEKARRYAVTITEMEKVYSYFKNYIVDSSEKPT